MSALPEVVDAWRAVAARRRYEGSLPLAALPRLRDALAEARGEVRYALEFGRDELGVAYLHVVLDASLPLACQRSLERFEHPVAVDARMGLVRDESEEQALPPGYEAVLVEGDELRLADVVEDELILALPLVPVAPGTESANEILYTTDPEGGEEPPPADNPFAALARLKKN